MSNDKEIDPRQDFIDGLADAMREIGIEVETTKDSVYINLSKAKTLSFEETPEYKEETARFDRAMEALRSRYFPNSYSDNTLMALDPNSDYHRLRRNLRTTYELDIKALRQKYEGSAG